MFRSGLRCLAAILLASPCQEAVLKMTFLSSEWHGCAEVAHVSAITKRDKGDAKRKDPFASSVAGNEVAKLAMLIKTNHGR